MPAEAAADHTPLEVAGNSKWKFLNALTIFVSALLLFQVEPLIAKLILPWFGGVAAVWMVCLLFFQLVLLLGYLYAHFLSPHVAHFMGAGADRGFPILFTLRYQPAFASLALKHKKGERCLSFLRAFERRLAPGPVKLPHPG